MIPQLDVTVIVFNDRLAIHDERIIVHYIFHAKRNNCYLFILCSSGVKKYNTSGDIPGNLCALCEGDCSTDSQKNKYVGYHGSFKCMADGKGDVSFAKHTTTEEVVDTGGYGNVNDYQYLCKDGSRKGNLRE